MSELADHLTDRYGVTVEGLVVLDQDVYRVDGPGGEFDVFAVAAHDRLDQREVADAGSPKEETERP